MLFKKHHIEKTLRGEKTQTRRRITNHSYKVGRKYGIRSHWFEKPVAHILITAKRIERLGDITPEDAQKEGGYTVEEYRREWEKINGSWKPDLKVYVYDYVLIKEHKEKQEKIQIFLTKKEVNVDAQG